MVHRVLRPSLVQTVEPILCLVDRLRRFNVKTLFAGLILDRHSSSVDQDRILSRVLALKDSNRLVSAIDPLWIGIRRRSAVLWINGSRKTSAAGI